MLKRREAIAAPAGNLPECVSRGRECRVPIDEALRDRFGLVEAAKFAQFGREFAGVPWVGGIALGGDAEMFERRDAVAALTWLSNRSPVERALATLSKL